MSMLVDWFFCTTMRLAPADAHSFMDSMAVLRRRRPDLQAVLDVVTSVEPMPPWMQLYALRPLLAAHGRLTYDSAGETDLGGDSESDLDPALDVSAEISPYCDPELSRRILQLCHTVLSSTDHPMAAALGALLTAVVLDEKGARLAVIDQVARPLAEMPIPSAGNLASMPYHDLNDQMVPSLTLIALAELTRRRPGSSESDWTGDAAVPLASAALRGEYGRLALLVAVEAAGRADRGARDGLWEELWRGGRGAPQLQPDLLDGIARSWFGEPGSDDPPPVPDLEAEAVTGDDLAGWSTKLPPDPEATAEFHALLTGRAGETAALTAVLWQSVLWSLAAEADPADTAARLTRWWQAPRSVSAGGALEIQAGAPGARAAGHLRALHGLRLGYGARFSVGDGPVATTDPVAGSAVCSPWLERWHDGWNHRRLDKGLPQPAFKVGGAGPAVSLIRLLAAATVAVSLVAELPPADDGKRDHLVALLFHTVDVLRDQSVLLDALALGEYTGEHPLGPAVVACLWHVNTVLHDTGTGHDERVHPRLLAEFAVRVLDDEITADLEAHEQAARLARQGVAAISTIWIRGAWEYSGVTRTDSGCARWFTGDPQYALRVLFPALDRLSLLEARRRKLKQQEKKRRDKIDAERRAGGPEARRARGYGESLTRGLWDVDLMTVAQLLREIYPADWPDPVRDRWPRLDVDWYGQHTRLRMSYAAHLKAANGNPAAITTNTARADRFLLSPTYPLEVWRDHSPDLESWAVVDGAPSTMRVLRLTALLQDPDAVAAPDYRPWIEDWLDRTYAVARTAELSLYVRALMVRLLEPVDPRTVAGHEYGRRLASVHEATIDAILEFGHETPRHVAAMLARLAGPVLPGTEGTDRLRLRALETIYRQQRYGHRATGLVGASQVRRSRDAAADLDLVLRRFLRQIAASAAGSAVHTSLLERAGELWERLQCRPLLQGSRVPLVDRRRGRGEPVPDILVAAAAVDRFRAEEVTYLLDVGIAQFGAPPQSRRTYDLFADPARRHQAQDDIAGGGGAALAVVAAAEEGQVWLNAGLGFPLPYQPGPAGPQLIEGEVVAADLRGRTPVVNAVRRLHRPDPEPGEVRMATVRPLATSLEVRVEGTEYDTYPVGDGAAAVDARRVWDPDLSRAFAAGTADPLPERVPVYWNAEVAHWMPVRRRLSELIVDEPGLAVGVRMVHAGDDGFVTRPGRLYRITASDWEDPDGVAALLGGQPAGLVVEVVLAEEGQDRLTVVGHDDANLRWLRLFGGGERELVQVVRSADDRYSLPVDSPPGFPDAVTVRGVGGGGSRASVIPGSWNDRQARRAEVPVTVVAERGVEQPHAPTPKRFEEMFTVSEGALLTLGRIFTSDSLQDKPTVRASTSTQLTVRVETALLTLSDLGLVGTSTPGVVGGRPVEVVQVRRPASTMQTGRPVSVDELSVRVHTVGADPALVRDLLTSASEAEGLVVTRVTPPGRPGDILGYGAWCRFGGIVHYLELDLDCFAGAPAHPQGQTFAAARTGDTWAFRVVPRDIVVRPLFRTGALDDPGPLTFVGTDGRDDIFQRDNGPVLIRRPATDGDVAGRLGLTGPVIAPVDARTSTTRPVVVRGRGDGPTLLGLSTFAGDMTTAVIGAVRLRLTPSPAGAGLVQVRRDFLLRAGVPTPAPRRPRTDYAGRWRRFLASGEEHALGNLDQSRSHVDMADGLRPPGPDGDLSSRVLLLPGEEPLVAGVHYRRIGARVRLVPQADGYVASFARATPITVRAFMARHGHTDDGLVRPFTDALHYVGPPNDDLNAHVFEWGFGWSVALPPDRIRLPDPGRSGLPALFHGDLVDKVAFVPAEDGGDPVMVVEPDDIRARFVTRVVTEGKLQHLHHVLVEISPAGGTVRVIEAQVTRGGDDPQRRTEWVPFRAALDADSVAAVLGSLPPDGATGLVRRRFLARFEFEDAIATGGRLRTFKVVRAGREGLRNGDRAFLIARHVEELTNELTVIFGMPPDTFDADDLVVRVNRRDFSFRQSTLARLHTRGLDGAPMLVRLFEDRRHWRGTTTDVPARRPETLVSYLARRGGAGYAVFGRTRDGLRLEIAPGVLFDAAGVAGVEAAEHGAVVRLGLDKEKRVVLVVAVPADASYVPVAGRPAVVLPKSPLLHRDPEIRSRSMNRGFVVSGLPDVGASPDHDAGPAVLAAEHPKICVVRQTARGSIVRPARPGDVWMARLLRPDPARPAAVRPLRLPAGPREEREVVTVAWARMSFRDGTAREVAAMCADHKWRHHDQSTGYVRGGRVIPQPDVKPGTVATEGVFFADEAGPTLRYPPESLSTYGFPAGALIDGPATSQVYAVAGPSADGGGVWLELGPGRVVEIRGALVTAEGRTSLDRLDWAAFGPGDEIGLRAGQPEGSVENRDAGPGHLVLTSWRPSVRGALPSADIDARILLPVRGIDRRNGALHLGAGRGRVTLPVAQSELFGRQVGDALWLDSRNDIEPAVASTVRPGDVVLLDVDEDGRLYVDGMPGVEVRVAGRSNSLWPGCEWLRSGLSDEPGRAALLAALGGRLAVTVDLVGLERPVVTVSRERQPTAAWPPGCIVRTEVLAALPGGWLLLASGSAVRRIRVTEAVAGLPAALAGPAAAAAEARPLVLWWQVDEDGRAWPGRAAATPAGQDLTVVPEFEVALETRAAGVACRDETGQLHWLDAARASWIRHVPADALLGNLGQLGRLTTRILADGSVSVTDRPAVAQHAARLALGHSMRVAVGEGEPELASDGRLRYLARLEMPPILLSYVTTERGLAPGASRLVEVDEIDRTGQPAVTTVDLNSRLVTLDLPQWSVAAHRAVAVPGEPWPDGLLFEHYGRWYREGLTSGMPDDPVEAVVRMAGELADAEAEAENGWSGPDPDAIAEVARRWLATHGEVTLNLTGDQEFDAAPLLAGAVVLEARGRGNPEWEQPAVLVVRQLGRRAAASLHTEQFAMAWAGRPDRHGLGGVWARLRGLDLTRELSPRQVRQLREFCRAMLTRPALRGLESDVAPIARSLLGAAGDLGSAADLLSDAAVLSGIAVWGRSLLPPAGWPTAQAQLLPAQRERLRAVTEHVVADALPLTLLPVVAPASGEERELARRLVQQARAADPVATGARYPTARP